MKLSGFDIFIWIIATLLFNVVGFVIIGLIYLWAYLKLKE